MQDDAAERSSFVIGLIENRAKEVPSSLSLSTHVYIIWLRRQSYDACICVDIKRRVD